jgi:hypothetical protein
MDANAGKAGKAGRSIKGKAQAVTQLGVARAREIEFRSQGTVL